MERFAYQETINTLNYKDISPLVVLCGARRTGKATIMYQIISSLLESGTDPKNNLFLSFDHPLLKLCSIDQILEVYRTNISVDEEIYCFFDEIQYAENGNNWLKILYDTNPNISLVATGSASPILMNKLSESALGRGK